MTAPQPKPLRKNLVLVAGVVLVGSLLAAGDGLAGVLDGGPLVTSPAGAGGPAVGAEPSATPDEGSSLVADRPYGFKVPRGYDEATPTPLVILLHGYTSNGARQDEYFRLSPLADEKTFLLAYPDGTTNATGQRFWNATDACCNFFASDVDDVAYLEALIDDVASRYNLDRRRVFVVGHSNGGFMSHRFACDAAPSVAAIVSLAGAQWKDPGRCSPASAVSVLQVHGTDDGTIEYTGGSTPGGAYPGAEETMATWAGKFGCTGTLTPAEETLDLDAGIDGNETGVARYSGCGPVAVELWTINGGGHVPSLTDRWAASIWDFMAAHPKSG